MNQKLLDNIFDLTFCALIILCLISAGACIVYTTAGLRDAMTESVVFSALGVGLSLFVFWIKSWIKPEGTS